MAETITLELLPWQQDLLMTTLSFASEQLPSFSQHYASIGYDKPLNVDQDKINRAITWLLVEIGETGKTQSEIDEVRRAVLRDLDNSPKDDEGKRD